MTTSLPEPYYSDDYATIYHAKCEQILPHLADKSVDLVMTDPPYEEEAHGKRRRVQKGKIVKEALPFGAMTEELRSFSVAQARRICTGWSVFFCQAEAIGKYKDLMGGDYRRTLLWFKPDAPPQVSGDRPSMAFESMALAHHADYDPEEEEDHLTLAAGWHGQGRTRWNAGGKRGVYIANCTDYVHWHPTQKSGPLMRELIRDYVPSTEALVIDFFAGACTTLVECKKMGIRCIGVEMTEEWCEFGATLLEDTEAGGTTLRKKSSVRQMGLGEVGGFGDADGSAAISRALEIAVPRR